MENLEELTKKLKLSEARFETIAKNAAVWLWETDENLRYTWFSERVTEVLGVPVEKMIGQYRVKKSATMDVDISKWDQLYQLFHDHKPFRNFEYEFKRKEEPSIWISISGHPFYDENSIFSGYRGSGLDISERVQMELNSKNSSIRNEALLCGIQDLIIRYDSDGTLLDLKFHDESMLYAPFNKQLGNKLDDVLPVELAELLKKEIKLTLGKKETRTVQYSLKKADESEQFFEARISPSVENEVVALVRDITEQHVKEQELIRYKIKLENLVEDRTLKLHESEKKYQKLMENLPDVFFQTNVEGIIVEASGAVLEMTGYHVVEVIGMKYGDLIFDSSFKEKELVDFIMKSGITNDVLFSFKRKDGTHWWGSVNARFYHQTNGKIAGIEGVIRDVTLRKRHEEELSEAREYSDRLIDIIPNAIIVTDEQGLICRTSDSTLKMFGYSREELHGNTVEMLVPKKHRNKHIKNRTEFGKIKGQRRMGEEMSLFAVHKNGTEFPIDVGLNTLKLDKEINILAIIRDISKWKAMESELVNAKDKAESANLAKTHFLANMSHEVRTPLNAISGLSQILFKQADSLELPHKFKQFLENIYNSSQILSEIVNNILELSKIEAGKSTLNLETININFVVKGIFQILSNTARDKQIEFNYYFDNNLPTNIISDRTKLNQILMNVAGNALKFTSEGGKVKLSTVLEESTDADALIVIKVEDNGIGISEEQKTLIFEPFQQADGSITRKYGGTGLGLSIVREMVQLLGGTMQVHSKAGMGSTFVVKLPLLTSDEEPGIQTEIYESLEFSPDSRVLVVEDDFMNQEMIKYMFEELNIQTEIATDGFTGVEMALDQSPELILMDVQMPEMDGFECTRLIREHYTQEEVPIVMLSAHAFSEHLVAAQNAGANDYLSKPLKFKELFPILKKYLRPNKKDSIKTAEKTTLPEDLHAEIMAIFDGFQDMPIYLVSRMLKPLNKIQELGKGYSSPLLDYAKQMEQVIHSGNSKVIPDILKKIIQSNKKE